MKWKGKINFELRPEINSLGIFSETAAEITQLTAKTTLADADLIMIEDSAASNAKKKVAISDLLPVFGTEYDSAESLGTSSTTSTAWQTKLTLTTGTLPAGTYMVNWTYEWAGSSASADVDIQVEVDNTTVIMDQRQEPKDPGTDQSNPKGGQVPITLTNATHTIDIDYRGENGNTAYIKSARLQIWRLT